MHQNLKKARDYIKDNLSKVDISNRDIYHFTPRVGWINDPNGFSFYKGKFNLFFQHYPYDTKWGRMHWGHAISDDLIMFKEQEIAMAPTEHYDEDLGCFSGSAIVKDDKLYAIYTGVGDNYLQSQNLAYLEGDELIKYKNNPIIPLTKFDDSFDKTNIRDPYVIKKDDQYYIFVGAKKKNNDASICLFSSKDLYSWNFVNEIYVRKNNNGMLECPSVAFFKDKMVLFCSPQEHKSNLIDENQNPCSSMYMVGQMDFKKGIFTPETDFIELDKGFDFYAPQVLTHEDKVYLIGWMNMWDKAYPFTNEGYAGKMTIVKELSLKDNHIYQRFTSSLAKYEKGLLDEKKDIVKKNIFLNSPCRIDLIIEGAINFEIEQDGKTYFKIIHEKDNLLKIQRKTNTNIEEHYVSLKNGHLEIFIDINSIELLIDDGFSSFACNLFTHLKQYEIKLSSDKLIKKLKMFKY